MTVVSLGCSRGDLSEALCGGEPDCELGVEEAGEDGVQEAEGGVSQEAGGGRGQGRWSGAVSAFLEKLLGWEFYH